MPKKRKLNIAILFGGRSAEHEVSLQSAKNVIAALDNKKYHPILIGISKSGEWMLYEDAAFLLNAENPRLTARDKTSNIVALTPQSSGKLISLTHPTLRQKIDVVFPVLHGTFGEDGTVQGLLKLAHVPFVGAGVLGSAVGMDKDIMKRLLRDADIPIAKFLTFRRTDPLNIDAVIKKLKLPIFVKPANLGSSVGIAKAKTAHELKRAIADAFRYDKKIIMEEYILGRELECAVLGNNLPIASVPGEVIPQKEFYSYEAKYIDENGAITEIPARIPQRTMRTIQNMAIKTFQTLSVEGFARVDFFLTPRGKVIVNEINTIPGFTAISMYPKLMEASGVSYAELLDELIRLAQERFTEEEHLQYH